MPDPETNPRLLGEALIDETLDESFPASDPPPWTLGVSEEERAKWHADSVELVIAARRKDIGGFWVRRVLPWRARREVGPFTFLDHSGPIALPPGQGVDVKPHPHIGIATLSYLFEGELVHRDSLGTEQPIRPGDVNWMIAGRGVVHSERSPAAARAAGARLHGVQIWVALAPEHEQDAPSFEHHPAASIPRVAREGSTLDVIAGSAFGVRAPTRVLSPTLCVHGLLERGARVALDGEYEERGVYVIEGRLDCDGVTFEAGSLVVLRPAETVALSALEPARILLIGGAKLPGKRYMDWNFVASTRARLERARSDWQEQRFARIPGDDRERVALPR